MPDITMCHGDGCELKQGCYRYFAKPSGDNQSWFAESPIVDDVCEYYWPGSRRGDPPGRSAMTIALDYDGTYTADPELWDRFIAAAIRRGHKVIVVTCRRRTDENREDVKVEGCPVFFTDLGSKLEYVKKLGCPVDVWIDDDPACVLYGK